MNPHYLASIPPRLWRIGRYPNPIAWTPLDFLGDGRFDDPAGAFRVLYAAEQRLGCFVETLAPYRPHLSWLAGVQPTATEPGRVPTDWNTIRRIAWLRPHPDLPALDLRAFVTREHLRRELAPFLHTHGLDDFDLGDALNRDRRLTQHIARWAFDHAYRAIAYPSRFAAELSCWVLFDEPQSPESAQPFTPLGSAPISRDDPDLIQAASLFGLTM